MPFFAVNERCTRKGQERCLTQGHAHLRCESAILSAVRLVRQNDDVTARGPRLSHALAKLMNQAKHITAVLIPQQAFKPLGAGGLVPSVGRNSASDKSRVNLIVKFFAVGQQHKRVGRRNLAVHLLAEEHHGIAFAAALCMPEHTQLASQHFGITRLQLDYGLVYTDVLVITGNHLYCYHFAAIEEDEVLDNI